MSSFFTIRKHGGETIEVNADGVAKRLADPLTVGRIFRDLGFDNELTIVLKDGPATIRRSPRQSVPSQSLQLSHPELLGRQDYLAEVQLKFLLPARVRCRGYSRQHVGDTITDVVRGRRDVPRDFSFRIAPSDLSALLGKMQACDITAIYDVEVTHVSPCNLLTDGRSA